jgi:membrane-associated protease RseP (regulator of RpoE activity)
VLLQRQRRGVQFALRAIPLGGFVAFPDDDEDSAIPKTDPNLLSNRPLPQRALVIAAGVLANCLLAWSVRSSASYCANARMRARWLRRPRPALQQIRPNKRQKR